MKMAHYQYIAIIPILIFALLCSTCTKNVSSIEVTNGDAEGRILNPDGTVAAGVTVRLIPDTFSPGSNTANHIDSTITDNFGTYSFKVTDTRYYNILAEKGSVSCMRDSLFLSPDTNIRIDDLMLDTSGSLSGLITMKYGSDPRNAVILLMGTDKYAVPDSTGRFSLLSLPQGEFTVRIFTSEEGYAVFDTTVTIAAGKKSDLSVTLPSTNAPTVQQLPIELDSARMYVLLQWNPLDTSQIVAYQVTRTLANGSDTIIMISKTDSVYKDDVILFEEDTLSYQIAAVGVNYKTGYQSVIQKIVPKSNISQLQTPHLNYTNENIIHEPLFAIASNDDYITLEKNTLRRFGLSGNLLTSYHVSDDNVEICGYQDDDAGNVYFVEYKNGESRFVLRKLTSQMQEVHHVSDTFPEGFGNQIYLKATRNGTLYLTSYSDTGNMSSINCLTYDSSLNNTGSFFRELNNSSSIVSNARIGDTIVVKQWDESPGAQSPYNEWVSIYDCNYNRIASFTDYDVFKRYAVPSGDKKLPDVSLCYAAPGGLVIGCLSIPVNNRVYSALVIMITDYNGTMLARKCISQDFPWSETSVPQFDSKGNIYFYSYLQDTNSMSLNVFGFSTSHLYPVIK